MDEVSTSKEGEGEGEIGTLELDGSTWRPRKLAFCAYSPLVIGTDFGKNLTSSTVARRPLVSKLTEDILSTYQRCNPKFQFSNELIPKRFLTSPHIGLLNDGFDNENSDLILIVNRPLVNLDTQRRYIIKEILGQGTFGQVAKCLIENTQTYVAVKIIKNQPAYYQQALVEVSILTTLNKKFDPEDKHHIVRIYDYFVHQRHLCIAFELLDSNLYEILKLNDYRGISLSIVQLFSKQLLRGLALMKDAGIIHCDLKPENILLCTRVKPAEIKIIDFGSACMEDRTVYSYIQSRYYRSPEVLLGYQYTTSIDMWSFGCIVAELYLGLPLFPGLSEFDLLTRMLDILGGQPPDYILKEAKNTSKFFKFVGSVNSEESGYMSKHSAYQVLTLEEYQARESKIPKIGKDYYIDMQLKDIVTKYPYRQNLSDEDVLKESRVRLALVDFLKGLVEFDPAKRWSPMQASKHPFVTGEPFTCPYTPSPETPRMSVSHNIRVDHHPAGGHWFAAGLSPNVAGVNRVALQNNSPHYQVKSYPHAGGSYGSLGSHGGSYQDGGVGAGSSYGSYGDNNINNYNNNMHPFYSPVGPSGMNMPHHTQGGIGTSPDARRRFIHNNFPHGNTGVGFSPTGNFAPMSLGTSPSQFTPPGSHYGPSSPARGNTHGSPLGKAAAVGQFNNRRKNWGYSGNMQSPESSFSSSPHWQGLYSDTEPNSPVQTWRQGGGGGGGNNGGYSSSHTFSSVPTHGSNMQFLHPKGVAIHDKPEASNSLPDPGDWDPNYSDELLLEEDGSEVNLMSNEFSKSMHLIQHTDPLVAARRYPNIPPPMQRQNGAIQGFAHGDPGSPPSSHDLHMGYGISPPMTKLPPHLMPQNSPSRLGQQPPRFNHGRSTSIRGNDWNHHQQQPQPQFQPQSFSGFNSGGPRSPGSTNGTSPWGRRGNYPVVNNMNNIPPTSRGRKDYGRIS